MLTITNLSLFGTHGFSITNEISGIHGRRFPLLLLFVFCERAFVLDFSLDQY